MRRVLTVFLMLLMLTPAMVCAMGFDAPAAAETVAVPPCHAVSDNTPAPPAAVPMLVQDCLQHDLAAVDHVDTPAPLGTFLIWAWALPLLALAVPLRMTSLLAHPPPPPSRRASFHRLLVTLRLRQ